MFVGYYRCTADMVRLDVCWPRLRQLVAMVTSTTTTMAEEVWSEKMLTADDWCPAANPQLEPCLQATTSIVRWTWKSISAWTRNGKDQSPATSSVIPYPVCHTFTLVSIGVISIKPRGCWVVYRDLLQILQYKMSYISAFLQIFISRIS